MGLHGVPHDGQSEAGSASAARTGRVGAMKAIKDPLALVGGDAGTIVLDGQGQTAGREHPRAEAHATGRLVGVRHRVGSQVTQRLGQAIGIGAQLPADG